MQRVLLLAVAALAMSCEEPLQLSALADAGSSEGEGEGEGEGDDGEGEAAGEGEGEGEGEEGEGEEGEGGGEGEGEGDEGEEEPQPSPPPVDPAPFNLSTDVVSHACEGDEDFCEPVPDLGRPWFDILASWSRVEGDTFVLEVLFATPSFLCWGQFGLLATLANDSSPDLDLCVNGAPGENCQSGDVMIGVQTWSEYGENGLTGRAFYPPVDAIIHEDPSGYAYAQNSFALGRAGRLMQLHIPLELVSLDGAPPSYALWMNHGGDVTFGDEGFINVLASQGGAIDGPELEAFDAMIFDGNDYCQ